MEFFVLYSILKFVPLNKYVMNLVSLPTYVKVAHFCLRVSNVVRSVFVAETACSNGESFIINNVVFFLQYLKFCCFV